MVLKKKFSTIACVLLLCGCSANPLARDLNVARSERPVVNRCVAVVSKLDIRPSPKSSDEVAEIKRASIASIYNSGLFRNVVPAGRTLNRADLPIYIDMRVVAIEESHYNWWLTWPAVYPATLYWPLQMKDGNTIVRITAELSRENAGETNFSVVDLRKYDINFYAFFRTSPIEKAYQRSYESAFDLMSKRLKTLAEQPENDWLTHCE